MKISEQTIQSLLGYVALKGDFPDSHKIVDLYKAVKGCPHEVELELRGYHFYSRLEDEKQLTVLTKDDQSVTFKKTGAYFTFEVEGEGTLVDIILAVFAEDELKKVKKPLYLYAKNDRVYVFEHHTSLGYLKVNAVTKNGVEYLTSVEMYDLYSSLKQKEFEDKIVMIEE